MIKTLAVILLFAAGLPLEVQGTDFIQSWTSSDGKIIEARFIRMEADAVVIERDGKPFTIPFTKLAPASVELAKRLVENADSERVTTTDTADEPSLQFRWLQTDPKTADAIVDLLKSNHLSVDAFSAKIDRQVKSGKITEVAAFERKIISGERFVLRSADGNLPLVMEAEATVGNWVMDLRCVPEWTPKTPMGSGLLWSNTAMNLSRQHWQLLSRWGDAKMDTLLLACGGANSIQQESDTSKEAQINRAYKFAVTVHLDAEWREASAADLAKVAQAPPENRTKALVWLRGRSTLLASATATCRSGQRNRQKHLWGGKSDAELEAERNKRTNRDLKRPPPRPGVVIQWEPTIMASDKPLPRPALSASIEENVAKVNEFIHSAELSLRMNSTYVPINARSKSPAMEFEFQGNVRPGIPEFVAAKEDPQEGGPLVVMVITPWYDIIR